MWPYVFMLALPIAVQHVRLNKTKLLIAKQNGYNNAAAMRLFWVILCLLLCLRHESVGIDLKNYNRIFIFICESDWAQALGRSPEVGYSFLNKVVSLFSDDFRWIIVISAVLGVYFIAKAYIKYSVDASLTMVLFLIMSNFILLFSGLRQSISISLGFLAFEYVRRKKAGRFLAVVAVAMIFHISAFMLLFMYPLYHMRITKKSLLWVIPVLTVVLVFNKQIFGAAVSVLSRFTKYEGAISSTGAYTMLMLFVAFAVFSYIIPDENKTDSNLMGLRNFMLFSVALQMFAPLNNLAMRMNYYFIAFIPLLIPQVIRCSSERWKQTATLARGVMLAVFVLYFLIYIPADNSLNTFPYRFMWEN